MTDVLASQHSQSNVDGVSPKNNAMIMSVPRYHFSHSPPGSMQSSEINLQKNANSNLNKITHNHEPKSPQRIPLISSINRKVVDPTESPEVLENNSQLQQNYPIDIEHTRNFNATEIGQATHNSSSVSTNPNPKSRGKTNSISVGGQNRYKDEPNNIQLEGIIIRRTEKLNHIHNHSRKKSVQPRSPIRGI